MAAIVVYPPGLGRSIHAIQIQRTGATVILILADAFDTHADVVEQHLGRLNAPFFRLNLDVQSLEQTVLHYATDDWLVRQGMREFRASDIRSIWPRRLTVSLTLEQQTEQETASFRLWRSEWNRCLYGLYASMRKRFWINPISSSSLSDNKYFQFDVARSVGFSIPEMITSNNVAELKDFCDKGPTAIKFMTQDIFRTEDGTFAGIYVNRITSADLNYFESSCENPITLQRYIEKDYEVRHTFVAGSHFCCKIESQRSTRSNVDWRRYDVAHTPHSVISPPIQISDKITSIMDQLELSYGAFDFIVDRQGDWWYLEVNSAGQWLWIEDLLDLPISERIAEALINGK
jgi:glutathione synthase/RimK-type ligase-like ATP-grasp enzyme